MKKNVLVILVSIVILVLGLSLSSCSTKKDIRDVSLSSNPTLNIDFTLSEGEISYGATGYLYGFSEDGVPSGDLLQGLKPKIAAVKAADGLQHPVGDVLHVASTFIDNGGEKLFIYMQDIYPEWYYVYRGQADYVEKVDVMMDKLVASEYKEHFIYCPFNENDNGAWYGNFSSDANRALFYADWKVVYDTIKAKDPNAYIAGPGYCNYNKDYIEDFLMYCKANDCIPNMMVWHELNTSSYKNYEKNYKSYRDVEISLDISPLQICISEYGGMEHNGVPGNMIQFMAMFEKTKVDACIAYWRLANNLCETSSDSTTPAAAWWIYNWYGQMKGNTYSLTKQNVKSDGFNGICAYNDVDKEINLIVGGEDGSGNLALNNITSLRDFKNGEQVEVEVEFVDYLGLGGDCLSPIKMERYFAEIKDNNLILQINNMSSTKAYNVKIYKGDDYTYTNNNLPTRYEAENATINGVSQTEKIATYQMSKNTLTYASSKHLIKNVWEKNKTITFSINIEKAGLQKIDICYGNGYKIDGERVKASGYVSIDGEEQKIILDNTISKDTTTYTTIYANLSLGTHDISIYKGDGEGEEIALDFIDVQKVSSETFYQEARQIDDGKYFVVTNKAGYYKIIKSTSNGNTYISSQNIGKTRTQVVYLQKGINIIKTEDSPQTILVEGVSNLDINIADMNLNGNIEYVSNDYVDDGQITSCATGADNYILWNINAKIEGVYALTFYYSSNEEIGAHAYNVQHVEQYANIEVNGDKSTYFFRSTFSKDNISTKTIYAYLSKGENKIKVYNDGDYVWNGNTPYMPHFEKLEYAKIVR